MDTKHVMKRLIGKSIRADIEKKTAVTVFDRFGRTNDISLLQYLSAKRAEGEVPVAREHHDLAEKVNSIKRVFNDKVTVLSHLRGACSSVSEEDIDSVTESITELEDDIADKAAILNITCNNPVDCSVANDGEWESDITEWKLNGLPTVPTGFK